MSSDINNEKLVNNSVSNDNVKVVKTDDGNKDGQNKCPKCGATDISLNVNNGRLRCNFCRHEFEPKKLEGMEENLSNLSGKVMASGAQDIVASVDDVLTFKCESCGAEVVVDTSETTNARCHWCRNTLTVNQQIPNGSIPDVVLPFALKREEARSVIEKFVGKRKFFAHPKFKREFTTNNIMGVYFPYMLVDVNSHANFVGEGEHLVRKYTRGNGDNEKTYYDADLYSVGRDFDLVINGLTVESSSDKLNNNSEDKTNNVINSIMPFDIENCVKWDANYLKGYTSEKRDTNVEQLRPLVEVQSTDIARFAANEFLKYYDRGVRWDSQKLSIKGEQWKAAYLPVWLYSYQEVRGNKKKLHYVAVNARTKEVMGSVPIHMPLLIFMSFLVEILGFFTMMFFEDFDLNWIFLFSGLLFYTAIYAKYRNSEARHKHETETRTNVANLKQVDDFIKKETGLSNSKMRGANNRLVSGKSTNFTSEMFNNLTESNELIDLVKNNVDSSRDSK